MTELNWRTLTQQSLALPYGRARTTGLEKALDLAIRGGATEEDVFHLRMSLTEAYKYGGEPARAMTTFTRCLTAFDADPARYGPEAHHRLLWQFKWIIAALTDFPEIPLDRTYALLDDMERRYRERRLQPAPRPRPALPGGPPHRRRGDRGRRVRTVAHRPPGRKLRLCGLRPHGYGLPSGVAGSPRGGDRHRRTGTLRGTHLCRTAARHPERPHRALPAHRPLRGGSRRPSPHLPGAPTL